ERFYDKLCARKREIVAGDYMLARQIAAWKRKVSAAWNNVKVVDVQRVKIDNEAIYVGSDYHFEVTLNIDTLRPEDIGAELVIAKQIVGSRSVEVVRTIPLRRSKAEGNRVTYVLDYRDRKSDV